MSRWFYVVALAVGAGCGGKEEAGPPREQARPVAAKRAAGDAGPAKRTLVEQFDIPEGLDEGKALERMGVLPAWEGVLERYRLLARRAHVGIVWGRLGEKVGELHWLIDETGGSGSLAIRVLFPPGLEVRKGDRLVVWGSWRVDGERRWLWEARKVQRLKRPKKDDPSLTAFPPGLAVREIDTAPDGAVPVSVLKRYGDITFEVISEPKKLGDGWIIGDRSTWQKIALLFLPGERRVYGGQEYLSDDELWKLEPKTRYTVKVKRFFKRPDGKPSRMHAITPPRKIKNPD